MARRSSIVHVVLGALAGLLLGIPTTESASAHPSVTTFGPHEHFVGLVNGQSTEAIIKMACTSPLSSTEMGHPLSGQTVAVRTLLQCCRHVGVHGLAWSIGRRDIWSSHQHLEQFAVDLQRVRLTPFPTRSCFRVRGLARSSSPRSPPARVRRATRSL